MTVTLHQLKTALNDAARHVSNGPMVMTLKSVANDPEAITILTNMINGDDPEKGDRGTGRTSAQISEAPHDAVFVMWGVKSYYTALLRKLGREDVTLIAVADIEHFTTGRRGMNIVVDHAAKLNDRQRTALQMVARDD